MVRSFDPRGIVLFAGLTFCPVLLGQATNDAGLPRALELYRTGDCKGAETAFNAILRTEPKNVTVRKMLADCMTQEGRTAEARQQYQQILQISPGDVDATQALRPPAPAPAPRPAAPQPANREAAERIKAGGEIERAEREIQAGRLDNATTILEALIKQQPTAVTPQQRLAEIYTRTMQYTKAAEIYSNLASAPGAPAEFVLREAQNDSFAENYPEAIRLYRQYLTSAPGDVPASLELANVLLYANRLDDAATAYRRYLDRRPDDFDARHNLANALLWSKQYGAALDELGTLAARRPRDPDLNLAMAQAYEQTGKIDEALNYYRTVLDIRPGDSTAAQARDRLVDDQPRLEAMARMARQDYRGAAQSYLAYLNKHPDDTQTMLNVARAYSFGKQYTDSAKYYDLYLQRVPTDNTAIRELGRVELTIPVYARARQDYELLTNDPRSTEEDYEGLVHAYVWDNKLGAAQPAAKKLLELNPANQVALETIQTYAAQQKAAALDQARVLTAGGRNGDAIAAYQSYVAAYGGTRDIELAVARLYGWDKQYAESVNHFQDYLRKYPDDMQARLELADNEKFAKEYTRAEADYRSVLRNSQALDPAAEAQALVGVAQIMDYRGDDPFRVAQAYRDAIGVDVTNQVANERMEQLSPEISPSLAYRDNTFSDSDGFGRSTNGVEASFPIAGGLRLTPFASYDYFNQLRQVGGADCGAATTITDPKLLALSNQICQTSGTSSGFGAGIRVGVTAGSHFVMSLEAGEVQFHQTHDDTQAHGQIQVKGSGGKLLTLSYTRRNGAYDLNTIFPMYLGIVGQNGFVSYEQPVTSRWDLWIGAGIGRYSAGYNAVSPLNTQKIFSARMSYRVLPNFTAGYYVRATTFSAPSSVYFSPSYYGTYGVTYNFTKSIAPNVSLDATGEIGYGRIDRYAIPGVNTVEVVIYPSVAWKVRPSLLLRLGYRFGRGSTSAFNTAAYTTGVFEFSLENYFVPPAGQTDPGRLEIH